MTSARVPLPDVTCATCASVSSTSFCTHKEGTKGNQTALEGVSVCVCVCVHSKLTPLAPH